MLLDGKGRLTKTVKFKLQQGRLRHDVGDPIKQAMVYEAQLADELFLLDIRASKQGRGISYLKEWALKLSNVLTIPLTVGGGIRSVWDVQTLLRAGADRVVIGSEATRGMGIIREASRAFGSQCITVAVDYRWDGQRWVFYSERGTRGAGIFSHTYLRYIEQMGAGEILLTSIDKEGTMLGYDLETIKRASREVSIPLVAHGGAGKAEDLVEAVRAGASAVAASSLWCFTDQSPIKAKAYMERHGISVRR